MVIEKLFKIKVGNVEIKLSVRSQSLHMDESIDCYLRVKPTATRKSIIDFLLYKKSHFI